MLKIRRSWDRLVFDMGGPYTGKTTSLYWEGPLIPSISSFTDFANVLPEDYVNYAASKLQELSLDF